MSYTTDLVALQRDFSCNVEKCEGHRRLFHSECPHWDFEDEADYREAKKLLKLSHGVK